MDLFCPLALVRPDEAAECRCIERVVGGQQLQVRDQRRMLTPLLERRTQEFRVQGGSSGEHTTHRRYITPQQASHLLCEAGFESVSWLREYDLSTAAPVDADARPSGPFMMVAET